VDAMMIVSFSRWRPRTLDAGAAPVLVSI